MAKKQGGNRVSRTVTIDSIRILNRLIPYRASESITARSDKLAIAVLQKFFGPEWIERHIAKSRKGFLRNDISTPETRETCRMRRVLLAEMLYNLQIVDGFASCIDELVGGQIESTYAALEIGRMLVTMATDKGMTFRFVKPSKTPRQIARKDYDLFIKFSDGVEVRGETKCKMEETKITLRTIESSMSQAKSQLPLRVPGIIFIKVPRRWIDDEVFAAKMRALADRFLARSPNIGALQYYISRIVRDEDALGETIGEIVAFDERTNPKHQFRKYRDRNWHMFPSTPSASPPQRMSYNGMPANWQRLFVRGTEL
jgi:hypothetical protein